ncbi:FAD-dependent monooxygenase [Streptomyces sp. NPDC101776]|uniref:FAD-dependent monooxygenase n=1 Tax=Streptomyces sp. NPDC101776 TaxID=3366146 RepID=UPI003814003D
MVGAGATGCTLTLLLARHGIPGTVVERRTNPLLHPAAHVVNARSFEIWHQASPKPAQEITELDPPVETVNIIRRNCRLTDEPWARSTSSKTPHSLRTYAPTARSSLPHRTAPPDARAAEGPGTGTPRGLPARHHGP